MGRKAKETPWLIDDRRAQVVAALPASVVILTVDEHGDMELVRHPEVPVLWTVEALRGLADSMEAEVREAAAADPGPETPGGRA